MSVSITLQEIPIGSQFVQAIGSNDPDALNDFKVRILTSENGTGLQESDIALSTGASLVSLTGSGVTWEVVIRPPETAGTLTITVGADAFSEGNVETSKDIRVSTSFPDDDAEVPSLFPNVEISENPFGITVTPQRILVGSVSRIEFFTHAGIHETSEQLTTSGGGRLDYINGDVISANKRHSLETGDILEEYPFDTNANLTRLFHTRLGLMDASSSGTPIVTSFRILPYGKTLSGDIETLDPIDGGNILGAAHQSDLLFGYSGNYFSLTRITASDDIEFVARLNIEHNISGGDSSIRDVAVYRNTLYMLERPGLVNRGVVYTLDIKKYRPMSLNTKTRIDVQFIDEGGTLDAKRLCPDAEKVIFSTGFNKPTWLSVDSDTGVISVASNAVTETSPIFVELTGINRIDSIDFSFYLIVRQAAAPTWRDVESLSMKANTTYDLHQIVDADSIAFESGETQPTDSSIANGIFTIGTTAGTARFTATKGSLTTDKAIVIDVIQAPDPDNFSDITRHKVEIAGIDVTADLIADTPLRVDKSLDSVELTRYRAHSVSVPLRNPNGKYNPDRADNFWATNSLNAGGFQERIKIYLESFINEAWVSTLLFTGIIDNQAERFTTAQVSIRAKDVSAELQRRRIRSFGTLEKWARLRQQSDEATFEGVYIPEGSLSPVQPESGKAWNDRTELTLRQLQLPSRGVGLANTGYLSANDLRTSGGFLENPPVLNAKALPRSEDVRFLIAQLALSGVVYNTDIQLTDVELEDPTILNRGSVPYSVENTRITRLPTDWVHDSTNDRLLSLLSNPEGHIADMLVQYDLESDTYRTLHTFDKDISVHRNCTPK